MTGTSTTSTAPGLGEMGQIVVKTSASAAPDPWTFDTAFLHAGVCGRFGLDKAAHAELALLKVQYWGPTATQLTGKELRPILIVDSQTIGGGITITDVGTQIHRACLGVTNPVQYWYVSTDTSKLASIRVDQAAWNPAANTEAGILYLSVARKAFKGLA